MKRKPFHYGDWLKEELKDPEFRKGFEEEDLRSRLAVSIALLRQKKALSQKELARRAHTTQQMISDIETFKQDNITLLTLQRIAYALGSKLIIDLR